MYKKNLLYVKLFKDKLGKIRVNILITLKI